MLHIYKMYFSTVLPILLIVAIFNVEAGKPPPSANVKASDGEMEWKEFVQKLDHFDSDNEKTFNQTYLIKGRYFNPTSRNVAYLYICDNSMLQPYPMSIGGIWTTTAQQTGALLFQLEHRYYGMSNPFFPDLSTPNLTYLSSRQAIEDIAYFIRTMNEVYQLSDDVKWVVFGGGYAGSLAAWIRIKHPDLVYAAVSSSASLISKLEYEEYFSLITEIMKPLGQDCIDSVQQGLLELKEAISDPERFEEMSSLWYFCPSMDGITEFSDLDVSYLMEMMINIFAVRAQYSNYLTDLQTACQYMTNDVYGTPMNRLASLRRSITFGNCIDFSFRNRIKALKTAEGFSDDRLWLYQTCKEFGNFQTTSAEPHSFGNELTVKYKSQYCQDVFGISEDSLKQSIDETNKFYGGLNITTDNILFVQNSLDPMQKLGKLESSNPNSPVIYINGTNYCGDMGEPSSGESIEIRKAKQQIINQILDWMYN